MSSEEKSSAVCKRCGKPVDGTSYRAREGKAFCSSCMIELAEQHIPDKTTAAGRASRKRQLKVLGKWILLVGCSALIIVNSVILVRLLVREKSGRFVPPDISKDATLCLSNLEHVSGCLKEGRLPPDSLLCPLSGEVYHVKVDEGDTVVFCPNPRLHKLRGLQVSKKNPVPEVLR
jgi:hypothetical protein